jgi:hypothetical protein
MLGEVHVHIIKLHRCAYYAPPVLHTLLGFSGIKVRLLMITHYCRRLKTVSHNPYHSIFRHKKALLKNLGVIPQPNFRFTPLMGSVAGAGLYLYMKNPAFKS